MLNSKGLVAMLSTAILLSGCASSQPRTIPQSDLKPGPGLFSGPSGKFIIDGPIYPDDNKQPDMPPVYRAPLNIPPSMK